MVYPKKYIYLIDFFLKKRDVGQGGVEGFTTPFDFTVNELSYCALSKEDIVKMLDVMKEEQTDIIVGNNVLTEPVVENYKIKGNKITVFNCSTEKLKKYKEKIRAKLEKSLIEINNSDRKIRYKHESWITFSEARRWYALLILCNNFPKAVEYLDIWDNIHRIKPFRTRNNHRTDEERKKDIQNIIDGLREKIKKCGIPEDAIEAISNEGYKLTI